MGQYNGRLTTVNEALTATVSAPAGACAADLPVGNLLDYDLLDRPARFVDLTSFDEAGLPTAAYVDLVFPRRTEVDRIGFLAVTLSSGGRLRPVFYEDSGLSQVRLDAGWTEWLARVSPSMALPWVARNWWTGKAESGDHAWVRLPNKLTCRAVRVYIDDRNNAAGYVDLGALFVGSSSATTYNYSFGHAMPLELRDLTAETPSGHVVGESRRARRGHTVSFGYLSKPEAMSLYERLRTAGKLTPVVFEPSPNDALHEQVQVWPALVTAVAEPVHHAPRLWRLGMTLSEVIA